MLSPYLFSPDAALSQVFDKTKDQKIIRKDKKELWNSVSDLLVYSNVQWNEILDHRYKTPALTHYPTWWWWPFFREYSMRVKLLATRNIQLEYVFYTWGNAQSLFVSSLKTLSAALRLSWVTISSPQGWEFDSKWRPKGGEIDIWKPEMANLPWVDPPRPPPPPSWDKPLIGV